MTDTAERIAKLANKAVDWRSPFICGIFAGLYLMGAAQLVQTGDYPGAALVTGVVVFMGIVARNWSRRGTAAALLAAMEDL